MSSSRRPTKGAVEWSSAQRQPALIADKFVDLYARDSGLRDKLIAERVVVLTYALRAFATTA